MSDGSAEFLVFMQIGAALGAICLAPVLIGHLVGSMRRGGGRGGRGRGAGPAGTAAFADAIAREPAERSRIRSLEYDAIEARTSRTRASAVRTLREMGSEDAMTTMLVAVLDNSNTVRSEAARGIASLADSDAVEPLVHAVATRSRRADGARQAILGLGPVALPELQRLEREASDPEMRHTAALLEHSIA